MSDAAKPFQFLEPGTMIDDELELKLLRTYQHCFTNEVLPGYEFVMQNPAGEIVGDIRLRIGNSQELQNYYGHIGFKVRPESRGQHFAERSCRLLFPLARRHGLRELWITCNPDNLASRRTCERLGGVLIGIVPLPPGNAMYLKGDREKCRYRITLNV